MAVTVIHFYRQRLCRSGLWTEVAKHGNRSASVPNRGHPICWRRSVLIDITPMFRRQALDELGVCSRSRRNISLPPTPSRDAGSPTVKKREPCSPTGPLINPAHPPLAFIRVYSRTGAAAIAETYGYFSVRRGGKYIAAA